MQAQELYAFATQGFLHRRGALTMAQVAALREQLQVAEALPAAQLPRHCIRSRTPVLDETRVRNLPEVHQVFVELADASAWMDCVDALVPAPCRITDAYSITRRRGIGLPLHSIDLARFRMHQGRPQTDHLTVMVCLSDCGPEDGPLVVIAGSHRSELPFPYSPIHQDWQVAPHQEAEASAALAWIDRPLPRVRWQEIPGYHEITFAAGDIVMFTEDLWHGALAVASPRVRRTLYYSYSPYHFANWHGLSRSSQVLAQCQGRRRSLLDGPFVGNSFASAPGIAIPPGIAVPHLQDDGVTPVVEALAARLAASKQEIVRAGRLRLEIDQSHCVVDLGARTVQPAEGQPEVQSRIVLSELVLRGILDGTMDPVACFYRGDITLFGDVALAMQCAAHWLPAANAL